MSRRQAKRVLHELTSAEKWRLDRSRDRIARELPDLEAHYQMRKDAHEENTLSGELRRAIHESSYSLAEIAMRAGITPSLLDNSLTGEPTLRSEVIDRVTGALGCELIRVQPFRPFAQKHRLRLTNVA